MGRIMWKAASLGAFAIATLTACFPKSGEASVPATGYHVLDGGTVVVNGTRVELMRVIAPNEKSPACEVEREAAAKVRLRIEGLFKDASEVWVMNAGMACINSRMRCFGFVTVDGVDLAELLTKEGLVASGSPTDPFDWCANPPQPQPVPAALEDVEQLDQVIAPSREEERATDQSGLQDSDGSAAEADEMLDAVPPPVEPTP